MMKSKVSIVRCTNYERERVEKSVREALELIGGIGGFVKSGQRVLIKPNLLSSKSPEDIVHTHPEIVRAAVRLVKDVGAVPLIGDSPGNFFTVKAIDMVYKNAGMEDLAKEEGVELVKFDKITHIKGYPIATAAKKCDCIISLPKMKTHDLAVMTGAIKNTFGLIPGLYKVQCHKKAPSLGDFSKILVDIFSIAKPRLSIMDGVIGMEGNGPGSAGTPRNTNVIMASSDAVSLDTVFSKMIGFDPSRNLVIKEAVSRNLGIGNLEDIEILGEKLENIIFSDYKLPEASSIYLLPGFVTKFLAKLLIFRPFIDEKLCKKCLICTKSCPVDAITINDKTSRINPGICVRCFCCHEVCPYNAISIKKNILARMWWK